MTQSAPHFAGGADFVDRAHDRVEQVGRAVVRASRVGDQAEEDFVFVADPPLGFGLDHRRLVRGAAGIVDRQNAVFVVFVALPGGGRQGGHSHQNQ